MYQYWRKQDKLIDVCGRGLLDIEETTISAEASRCVRTTQLPRRICSRASVSSEHWDTASAALTNKNLGFTDTFNYLGAPTSAKDINFKLMYQSRVGTAIKVSAQFKIVSCNGGNIPHYSEKNLHSLDARWRSAGLVFSTCPKRKGAFWIKVGSTPGNRTNHFRSRLWAWLFLRHLGLPPCLI